MVSSMWRARSSGSGPGAQAHDLRTAFVQAHQAGGVAGKVAGGEGHLRDMIAGGRALTPEATIQAMSRYATEPATDFA